MNWEKLYPNLSFTVENKVNNLHKIRSCSHFQQNEIMRYFITSTCKNLPMNWKKCFPLGKTEF